MAAQSDTSPEYDKFTDLVDTVLSVPKKDAERIRYEPMTEEEKSRILPYLRREIEADERRHSQVIPDK
ncbi:MAG: hypothetical protein HIU91_16245 [Acidobacteria bacterium]|nr:hypothetical protein [Acidobacteriota bacterium]